MTSLLSPKPDDPLADARLAAIREHVETAHREVQSAQRIAYNDPAPWRIRMGLNKAQDILIRLLIHRLPPR
jgi:hypothetical protein